MSERLSARLAVVLYPLCLLTARPAERALAAEAPPTVTLAGAAVNTPLLFVILMG